MNIFPSLWCETQHILKYVHLQYISILNKLVFFLENMLTIMYMYTYKNYLSLKSTEQIYQIW